MEAESYSGDGRVFTARRVPLTDVAWIDTQGPITAPAGRARYPCEQCQPPSDSQGQRSGTPEQQEFFRDSQIRDEQGTTAEVYHGQCTGNLQYLTGTETQRTDGGWFGRRSPILPSTKGEARMYGQRVVDAYLNIKNPCVRRANAVHRRRKTGR